jgi:starch synthase
MLYWDVYHNQGLLNNAKIMLTIHNMDNTGECREEEFMATGVPGSEFNTLERAMDERTIGHNPERLCLMKGAIVYANYVTTVSPTYAREALSGSAGFLGKTLTKERTKFTGVINGVDTEIWDARLDNFLPANFKPGTMEGKALCKKYVQMGLGLNVDPHKPLVVCISRLVPQKGINLIEHAIPRTKEKGGQFVLLGSGHSDPPFSRLAESVYKNDKDVKLLIVYSDALSHLLYAAADCVLVPSMFEPCGLTQMIAMCYGALPIVRKTGGLADTVHDVDDPSMSDSKKNGFVFEGADNGALEGALDRALRYYHERKPWWQGMQEQVMDIDNSWERAGEEYVQLYRSITGIREEFPDHGGQ